MSRAMTDQERYEHGVGPVPHTYLVPAPPVLWVPVPLRVPVPSLPGRWVETRDQDEDYAE